MCEGLFSSPHLEDEGRAGWLTNVQKREKNGKQRIVGGRELDEGLWK